MKTRTLARSFVLSAALCVIFLPDSVLSREEVSPVSKALAALERSRGPCDRVAWHADGKRIKTLSGNLSGPGATGSPQQAAKAFLSENAELLRLKALLSDLHMEETRLSPAGYHVRFAGRYGGLPVFNDRIEVHLSKDVRVFLVQSDHHAVTGLRTRPSLSGLAAIRIARDNFSKNFRTRKNKTGLSPEAVHGKLRFTNDPEARLGVFMKAGRAHLAYRFGLVVENPAAASEYVVDAHSGKILQTRSLVQEVMLDGHGDADSALLSGAYLERDLLDITRFFGLHLLIGPYVNVTDRIEAPRQIVGTLGYVLLLDRGFQFRRDETQFEHVVCYYHIDSNQRYIQSLGFSDVNNRRQAIDPHGLSGADNAHYLGFPIGAGWIAMGDGGVDDGEDADVILHEYGHAIQDNQTVGKYFGLAIETGAQGEGFSDYWAASNTHATSVANGFDPACIAEWDSTSYSNTTPPCLRRVDGTKHYPEDLVGQVHSDGEIWSAALWDLFNTLGKATADTLVLQSHFLVPFGPSFSEGAEAILDADAQLFGGANAAAICDVFGARGIPVAGCQG